MKAIRRNPDGTCRNDTVGRHGGWNPADLVYTGDTEYAAGWHTQGGKHAVFGVGESRFRILIPVGVAKRAGLMPALDTEAKP